MEDWVNIDACYRLHPTLVRHSQPLSGWVSLSWHMMFLTPGTPKRLAFITTLHMQMLMSM